MFFALGGLTALFYDLPDPGRAVRRRVRRGRRALYAVAAVINAFRRLGHDGTARLTNAVGTTGVGLPAGAREQRRPRQGDAHGPEPDRQVRGVRPADPIPTGAAVRVVAVRGTNAVEVEPVTA